MNSRLEKVRKLKLDVSEKAPAPARRWVLWLLLAISVGSIAFLLFKNALLPNSISRTIEASTASAPAAPATSTSVAPTETPRLNRFTAAGYVEPIPPFPIHISPLVLGRIDEFTITEGQPVKAGQIIAKLNSQEFEKRLAELQAALGVNAERLALAESELARSKRLAATGVATGKELEQASADAAVLRAEAVKLQAAIQTVEWQIQQTAVRAPVGGVLFERLANVGSYIYSDSNREIASIYDPAKLQIWVDVNQRDVARLRVGQPAEVTLDADPGKVFTGEVSRILPRASLSKNTIQAKILLHETSPSLRPDMSVKVTFLEKEAATAAADKTVTAP
jgi:HlyD family secretion protein